MAGTGSPKKMIKNYPIIKVVGKGGMGEVYLAKHPTLKREIILKRLSIRDKDASKRFLEEAKIMLEFRHENIVQIYDHFKEGASTYIAMEYVKGKALNDVIHENETIPIPLALFILYQAALGVHHAHVKKVIHRDIKPHNILISVSGQVKLTDFGISKRTGETQFDEDPGAIVGTPAYMPPEQFKGDQFTSIKSDIYSLGIVFYEMITGVRPYKNEYSPEVVSQISKGKYAPVRKYLQKPPLIVNKILKKTFNADEKKRYKSLIPLIKLLKKYFKKYNIFEIRDSVKRLLINDKKILQASFFQSIEKIRKRKRITGIITAACLITGIAVFSFIYTNRFYEWIMPGKYGKVSVEFKRAGLDPDNIFIIIESKNSKDNKAKKTKNIKYYKAHIGINYIKFLEDRFLKKKAGNKLNNYIKNEYNRYFYLNEGEHNISIVYGSYKNSKKILVTPRVLQRKNKTTKDGQRIYIPIAELWSQNVSVYFRFWDAINFNNYLFGFDHYVDKKLKLVKSEEDNLKILYKKKYINLKNYYLMKKNRNESPFMSGLSYIFRVEDYENAANPYFRKTFRVDFNKEDRTVVVHTPLIPKPAKLIINSNVKKLPIIINNESKGLIFMKTEYDFIKYSKIEPKKNGDQYTYVLLIPPQKFSIKFSTKGKEIKGIIKGDKELVLNVKKENGEYKY